MQAQFAYIAGMKNRHVQYTIRNVPPDLDGVVRNRARETGKSINAVLIDAIQAALSPETPRKVNHDFDDLIGTWVDDPEFDRAVEEQRRIDPELWK